MKCFAFDKTGTITCGTPVLVYVGLLSQAKASSSRALLALIGTAESGSEHPIAKAISSYAKQVCQLEKKMFLCTLYIQS